MAADWVGSAHRRHTPQLLLTLAVAAASLGVPASARAAEPVTSRAAVPSNTCRPNATAADRKAADALRPLMNGRRLGSAVNSRRIACARMIVDRVRDRGLPMRAAVIAVTTAIAESTLSNHTVALDHDSLGLFQQRPSQGWGRPAQLVDPGYATDKFLDAMLRKYPRDSWMSGDIAAICQRVQVSAFPRAYAPEVHDAQQIVAYLWTRPGSTPAGEPALTAPDVPGSAVPGSAPSGPGSSAPASSAPPKKPAGPFEKVLAGAGTELGRIDGRHGLAMADWDGDRRPDLVIVNGSGSVTGQTDVRVMGGATNFASLLLSTATVIAPTDVRHAYAVADVNGDNRPDVMVVQKNGTASGRTEVRVADVASFSRSLLLDTATALPATDDRTQFSVADWNADGRPDLVATQTTGTASGKVEVQVLDGATGFQQALLPVTATSEPAADGLRVTTADFNGDKRPDVVVMKKSGAATDIRVLDGAAALRRQLLRGSAPVAADDRHELLVTDWDADARPDLVVVQKSGTASGRAEFVVLSGR
ncbi:VCBS repeat-containing protein [Actinoplanes sp. DH11]|uniref:FG-GAP repeat domain-containing protein n=1 Tax=Actinoplanes sp. DH11 TaxID=2857011 RepID=UPI001E37989C|nr:VCBS repeat-containing protein [Actinoplanes sp. DH11]